MKSIGNIIIDIGFGATTLIGLLIEGGEFFVLTVVFVAIIFFRGKRQDKFINKTAGSRIFICVIIAFSLFYAGFKISKGEMKFGSLLVSEKLLGMLFGWIIIAGLILGIILVIKDSKRKNNSVTETQNSSGKSLAEKDST